MKHFYYVHNRKLGNPTFRHETKKSAEQEAIRLSKMYHKNFYVLEAVEKICYNDGDPFVDMELELPLDER